MSVAQRCSRHIAGLRAKTLALCKADPSVLFKCNMASSRQVVLEIGNTHVKAGFIEISSLPLKIFPSWGKKNSGDKFFSEELPLPFDDSLHIRAIKNNQLVDFDFLLELIEHAILNELNVPKESLEHVQLTLVLPSNLIALQLPLRTKLIKALYDVLKVAGVFLVEVACMATAGSNHGTALVLNFDEGEGVEISAVSDFSLLTSAVDYFALNRDLRAHQIKDTESFCKVFIETRNEDGLNLLNVIESVLERVETDRRSITLNHIILNSSSPNFPLPYHLLLTTLQSILSTSPLLCTSDYPADTQPASFAFRSIPEFYNELKETGMESVAWFGATITGKYAHADSKTFIPPKSS